MFLFYAPILASNECRNEEKMSVVIHALLFVWYLEGNFFIFLKHRGFGDFPMTIGTCLSLPSLLTQSKTVTFPESFEDLVYEYLCISISRKTKMIEIKAIFSFWYLFQHTAGNPGGTKTAAIHARAAH
jgi:hypothetical protein